MKRAKARFVLVDHSILDWEDYKEEFLSVSSSLKADTAEVVEKYGLRLVETGKFSPFRRKAVFYNKQLDMEVMVRIRKRHPPEFV